MQPGTILIGLGLVLLILLDTYDPRFILGLKPTLAKAILGRFPLDVPVVPGPRSAPRQTQPAAPAQAHSHADLLEEMEAFCRWLELRRSGSVGD